MERALDPALLELALGEHETLPSAEELASTIADAEVQILLGAPSVPQELRAVAWYLHSVASVKPALEIYGPDRQRAAFQVAAHIFDVALQEGNLDNSDRLEYGFASQVAYFRSSLDPNASAVYRREIAGRVPELDLVDDVQLVATALGCAILALDADYLFGQGRRLRSQVEELSDTLDAQECSGTILGAVAGVVLGVWNLLVFLVYGESERLERAIDRLQAAVVDEGAEGDRLSRWVAAHLVAIAEGFRRTSIWTALPPQVPPGIKRGFALASPRVVSLWPPQLQVLATEDPEANPLYSQAKRALLSMPTSAGKTLIAQLLVASHLGTETSGVCYVAPTRSLCAEVASTLNRRLNYIDFSAAGDFPEFADLDEFGDLLPDVEVMTPERLAYLLRQNPSEVLERFGLFIFDEAHTVSDAGRGWTLESILSYLHHRTVHSQHRMVLMSAAIGNSHHFVQWLTGEEASVATHTSAWRGPRRMHCLWRTEPHWDKEATEETRSVAFPVRRRYPMIGRLVVRPTRDGRLRELTTQEPIGELVLRVPSPPGRPRRDSTLSTAHYRMLVPLISFLSRSGPVLVVEGTRRSSVHMARAIAEDLPPVDSAPLAALQELVTARLGPQHPLNTVLPRSVGFHHGALPLDIRHQLEEAMREGDLQVLVATTSLTEGVNLPVRAVVVASQGAYGPEGFSEFITGPRLINAVGRAGRATQETEAIVVLAPPGEVGIGDLEQLDPPPEALQAFSSLATAEALAELSTFEQHLLESQDAVFERQPRLIGDFLAFVWLIANELEEAAEVVTVAALEPALSRTLAWQQVSREVRDRYLAVASAGIEAYSRVPSARRRRWSRTGTSIPSAAVLQEISNEVADFEDEDEFADRVALVVWLLEEDRLVRLLQVAEAPTIRVFNRRGGANRLQLDVPVLPLLTDWLRGVEIVDLGNRHLSEVENLEFRAEQLGDVISQVFETFLPWVLGVVITWANEIRSERRLDLFPGEIPALVRWGVDRLECVRLMIRGIRSRRLCHAIVSGWEAQGGDEPVLSWLRGLRLEEWRAMFSASPVELADLISVVGPRRGGISAKVLAGDIGEIELDLHGVEVLQGAAQVRQAEGVLGEVEVAVEGQPVGSVPSRHYQELSSLLATGLRLAVAVEDRQGKAVLTVRLAPPD